ncbi:carboxymuconolactone decarboxylase family protein [Parapedobacter indicus]|uniref:Alkylhydroperoxidase AhpD family core domain-containing protein n=1 Tax=Parapedobacter indicus TaxID=1477437 RepID=A0A1I3RW32_9SPHI|nr:carboxymuconolactone decarboxylase family protein [Parapedobacter indicus]PPK99949.1 AhpD family alkylhydroperoxidase [Parapedobacter indicus]SFJ50803.1 alkylhydroperoxidase AhpD family core domain-containing protein [Parapedobacter indicus]
MEKRININTVAPQAYKAIFALEGYLAKAEISKKLKELIKIRASQINGCAFCINMHTKDALKNGETDQRIFLLNAWREALGFFTEEEQIVLAMTEEITLINKEGLTDDTYDKASAVFSENQIAEIITAIATINVWNRIAISTRMQPGE